MMDIHIPTFLQQPAYAYRNTPEQLITVYPLVILSRTSVVAILLQQADRVTSMLSLIIVALCGRMSESYTSSTFAAVAMAVGYDDVPLHAAWHVLW